MQATAAEAYQRQGHGQLLEVHPLDRPAEAAESAMEAYNHFDNLSSDRWFATSVNTSFSASPFGAKW